MTANALHTKLERSLCDFRRGGRVPGRAETRNSWSRQSKAAERNAERKCAALQSRDATGFTTCFAASSWSLFWRFKVDNKAAEDEEEEEEEEEEAEERKCALLPSCNATGFTPSSYSVVDHFLRGLRLKKNKKRKKK
jgi:hypothetical protein